MGIENQYWQCNCTDTGIFDKDFKLILYKCSNRQSVMDTQKMKKLKISTGNRGYE